MYRRGTVWDTDAKSSEATQSHEEVGVEKRGPGKEIPSDEQTRRADVAVLSSEVLVGTWVSIEKGGKGAMLGETSRREGKASRAFRLVTGEKDDMPDVRTIGAVDLKGQSP